MAKFNPDEPEQYSVAFEEQDGTPGQTAPVSYNETDKVREALEIQGQRVTGVVKNPKR